MKHLADYIVEKKFRALARCFVEVPTLDELTALIKQKDLQDVIYTGYAGGSIMLWVPEEAAADDDYAKGFLKELIDNAPEEWKFSKIEKLM